MKKQTDAQEQAEKMAAWTQFDKCLEWVQYAAARFASIPHIGLTHAEFTILQRVDYFCTTHKIEAVTVGQLVIEELQSKSAVSKMLNTMEKKQLISRQVSPHNRRNVLVRMTQEGRRLYQLNAEVARKQAEKTTQQLGCQRVAEMMSTLMECVEIYEKNLREGTEQERRRLEAEGPQ